MTISPTSPTPRRRPIHGINSNIFRSGRVRDRPSYVSLGGEVRERFESYLNPNFGLLMPPPSNAYLLHRLLLDADVHVTDHLRAFFQPLGEMERLGDRGK